MGFLLISWTFVATADNLRIAVAANFYPTLKLIKQRFEQEQPNTLTIIRGSTGKLYAQIKHGAPYDVFLAADIRRPKILEDEKLIVENSRFTYAIGQLALWSKNNRRNIFYMLESNHFNKLAIANPKTAPYGQAAIDVLKFFNLYEMAKDKLVYGENIAQAFQFTQSGSADLGFVALSNVKHLADDIWVAPANSHIKLEQQMVVLKSSKKPALGMQFLMFMQRDDIQDLIHQQGYAKP